jgi:hypothetical protein
MLPFRSRNVFVVAMRIKPFLFSSQRLPAMASPSSQALLSPLASPQGVSSGVLATFNMGAYADFSHTSDRAARSFGEKLALFMKDMMNAGVDIICLQEVNLFWHQELKEMISPRWQVARGEESRCNVLYDGHRFHAIEQQECSCVPDLVDAQNPYRHWRRWLQVDRICTLCSHKVAVVGQIIVLLHPGASRNVASHGCNPVARMVCRNLDR